MKIILSEEILLESGNGEQLYRFKKEIQFNGLEHPIKIKRNGVVFNKSDACHQLNDNDLLEEIIQYTFKRTIKYDSRAWSVVLPIKTNQKIENKLYSLRDYFKHMRYDQAVLQKNVKDILSCTDVPTEELPGE